MTATAPKTLALDTEDQPAKRRLSTSLVLLVAGLLAVVVGVGAVAGGVAGAWYTHSQAAVQNITTPDDAVLPSVPVRGPLSMWAQADIITHHQLDRTDGLYYAEMDRMVPSVDENGEVVTDENGETVMVPNEARSSWMSATTLTTALSLGVLSYALAGLAIATGLTLAVVGVVFLTLRRRMVAI